MSLCCYVCHTHLSLSLQISYKTHEEMVLYCLFFPFWLFGHLFLPCLFYHHLLSQAPSVFRGLGSSLFASPPFIFFPWFPSLLSGTHPLLFFPSISRLHFISVFTELSEVYLLSPRAVSHLNAPLHYMEPAATDFLAVSKMASVNGLVPCQRSPQCVPQNIRKTIFCKRRIFDL